MVTEGRDYVWGKLAGLCEPLYEAFQKSAERVDDLTGEALPGRDYEYAKTHLTRALAHRHLTTAGADLAGWRVTGNHQRNGELWLRHGMTRLRLLHTNSDKLIPVAGQSRPRRAYYRNTPLVQIPEQLVLDLAEQSQLIGAWRIVDRSTYEASIRVVRPISPGRFEVAQVDVDLDFFLPRSADEQLEFTPTDEDLRLDLSDGQDEGDDQDGNELRG